MSDTDNSQPNEESSQPTERYAILVVDDDELTRQMYTERLKQEGKFRIYDANDGLEALQIMTEEEIPDLVFTGIIMPRMNGFQLIEAMQDRVQLSGIPVMISSHMGRQQDKEKADELGIQHFIVRGQTTPDEVAEIMHNVLVKTGNTYVLRIDPNFGDYEAFVNDQFPTGACNECHTEMKLPIELRLVDREPEYRYAVNLRCDQCRK